VLQCGPLEMSRLRCASIRRPFSSDLPAPPLIFSLPLHDALPISLYYQQDVLQESNQSVTYTKHMVGGFEKKTRSGGAGSLTEYRSEEHTSELQSRENLVCRLLLEKKKTKERNS